MDQREVISGWKAFSFQGRTAISFSLIASCKGRVERFAYLRDLFTRLPAKVADPADAPDSLLDSLLPDAWLAANLSAANSHR